MCAILCDLKWPVLGVIPRALGEYPFHRWLEEILYQFTRTIPDTPWIQNLFGASASNTHSTAHRVAIQYGVRLDGSNVLQYPALEAGHCSVVFCAVIHFAAQLTVANAIGTGNSK